MNPSQMAPAADESATPAGLKFRAPAWLIEKFKLIGKVESKVRAKLKQKGKLSANKMLVFAAERFAAGYEELNGPLPAGAEKEIDAYAASVIRIRTAEDARAAREAKTKKCESCGQSLHHK